VFVGDDKREKLAHLARIREKEFIKNREVLSPGGKHASRGKRCEMA